MSVTTLRSPRLRPPPGLVAHQRCRRCTQRSGTGRRCPPEQRVVSRVVIVETHRRRRRSTVALRAADASAPLSLRRERNLRRRQPPFSCPDAVAGAASFPPLAHPHPAHAGAHTARSSRATCRTSIRHVPADLHVGTAGPAWPSASRLPRDIPSVVVVGAATVDAARRLGVTSTAWRRSCRRMGRRVPCRRAERHPAVAGRCPSRRPQTVTSSAHPFRPVLRADPSRRGASRVTCVARRVRPLVTLESTGRPRVFGPPAPPWTEPFAYGPRLRSPRSRATTTRQRVSREDCGARRRCQRPSAAFRRALGRCTARRRRAQGGARSSHAGLRSRVYLFPAPRRTCLIAVRLAESAIDHRPLADAAFLQSATGSRCCTSCFPPHNRPVAYPDM